MTNARVPTFLALLIVAALTAAIFGALHNQLSYSVGPTYFTGLKFGQFNIASALPDRVGAALVGVYSSWWMGPALGLPAFLYGLLALPSARRYLGAGLGAIFLVIVLATTGALAGLLGGIFADTTGLMDPYLTVPEGPTRSDFLRAGFMHEASYIAGGLGALAAFVPMRHARKIDLHQAQTERRHAT